MDNFIKSQKELSAFTIEQLIQKERQLIKSLDWDLGHHTLLDQVELILSFGVVDENDSLLNCDEQVKDLEDDTIWEMEKKIAKKARAMCLKIIGDQIYFEND